MNKLPKRKKIRIEDYDYATVGAYFITVCTANKEKIFWDNVNVNNIDLQNIPLSAVGEIVEESILQIPQHYENVVVDKYCVMPDHIHMILQIVADIDGEMKSSVTISTIIGSMKRWVSKQIGKSVWQKSFYDHGIRNRNDYAEIWEYIENNPLKYTINHVI